MDTEELAAIKAASANRGSGSPQVEDPSKEEEARRNILAALLDSDARERRRFSERLWRSEGHAT